METFFASMDANLQLYWYIAIGASFIFIIQTILAFITAGDDSLNQDFDSDEKNPKPAIPLFSFRNLVNFLLGFGWTGVVLFSEINNQLVLGIVAFFVGVVFVGIFFTVIRTLGKLSESSLLNTNEAMKKTAEVCLPIPPNKEGKGKVLLTVRGAKRELRAVTYSDRTIESGMIVTIVGIENSILIVEPLL